MVEFRAGQIFLCQGLRKDSKDGGGMFVQEGPVGGGGTGSTALAWVGRHGLHAGVQGHPREHKGIQTNWLQLRIRLGGVTGPLEV